jgi:hypothetical protein
MADASVSKTDEGNLVRVRLPLSAPGHPDKAADLVVGITSLYSSTGLRGRQILSTERGQPNVSITVVVRGASLFERVLVSVALVLLVALIYQLIVGGVKIEVANGRLTVDPSGFVYWWHVVTGAVTPKK